MNNHSFIIHDKMTEPTNKSQNLFIENSYILHLHQLLLNTMHHKMQGMNYYLSVVNASARMILSQSLVLRVLCTLLCILLRFWMILHGLNQLENQITLRNRSRLDLFIVCECPGIVAQYYMRVNQKSDYIRGTIVIQKLV